MLKFFYLLFIAALISGTSLKAEEASNSENPKKAENAESSASEEITSTPDVAPAVEVPESELVEMVGFLTAQGGGVPMLKLDDAGIAALTNGLMDGLSGAKTLDDFPEERIRQVFGQVQKRAEAIEAGSEEIPVIKEDALQVMGFIIALQSGLVQLEFDAEEVPFIKKGFIAGANATEADPADKVKLPAFQEFIQKRVMAAQAKAAADIEAANQAFFEELATDPMVQKSESGLYYKIIKPGATEKPTLEDSVLVHYKGTLIDGTKFDSSYDRGNPAEFPLKGVVKGFGEGLTKIGAGGKIILYIPSELGYGNNPRPGGAIKPGDTLIFECELIEVNPE